MDATTIEFDQFYIRPLTINDLIPYFQMIERNRKRLEDFFTGTVSRTRNIDDTLTFLIDVTERANARTYFLS